MDDQLTRLADSATVPGPGAGDDFEPGTLFAGRFRIVALLGRGGMGEVYRADDLKLGQPVALKLLPERLAGDPARLAQFHNEVRVAREVSHRNVCRTYDIGEAGGRHFISMEYVDGEDLASLLRRIGRFPQDRASEVARQICAGIAAAHERGVLHRDLKPANIMIDGEGHVRITDFGLAGVAGRIDDIRSGTPAYMAPEQLAGREVTIRSDIYALGLVLFELFTGKRVFEAANLAELVHMHESGAVATPTSVVRDLDPTIERVILRCLQREPEKRPSSALVVSAALPGGSPLAAALAAGETPSPEMVAAAGEQSALRPAIGLALVAFTLVMLAVLAGASQRFSVVHRLPFLRSIDSLRDRAQELIERFGYRDPPYDTADGFAFSRGYLDYARRTDASASDPWQALPSGRTGTLTFWYRTSPVAVVPSAQNLRPTPEDPQLLLSEMRFVRLDLQGRLIEFHSIPPQIEERADTPAATPDWAPLFDAAGLSTASFKPADPRWTPRGQSDVRAAWEGPLPGVPGATARVEAAAYRGRPIFFSVIAPWTQPARMPVAEQSTSTERIISTLSGIIGLLIIVAAALLARRHLRTGRGDRRGAFRTAAIVFLCQAGGWLLYARHYGRLDVEYGRVTQILALTLFSSTVLWLLYIAFEPYIRRFWPELLIGWTRFLSGHVRDPLVGRDVLVGAAAGTVAALLIASRVLVPHLLGRPLPAPQLPLSLILEGTRYAAAAALEVVPRAFRNALECVCVVVFLKILVRRTWLVLLLGTVAILPIAMNGTFAGEQLAIEMTIAVLGIALVFSVLLRFGLLSLIVMFCTFLVMDIFPLTIDFSRPYAGASLLLLVGIAGLSAFGFYASRGSEPLLGRTILD